MSGSTKYNFDPYTDFRLVPKAHEMCDAIIRSLNLMISGEMDMLRKDNREDFPRPRIPSIIELTREELELHSRERVSRRPRARLL